MVEWSNGRSSICPPKGNPAISNLGLLIVANSAQDLISGLRIFCSDLGSTFLVVSQSIPGRDDLSGACSRIALTPSFSQANIRASYMLDGMAREFSNT